MNVAEWNDSSHAVRGVDQAIQSYVRIKCQHQTGKVADIGKYHRFRHNADCSDPTGRPFPPIMISYDVCKSFPEKATATKVHSQSPLSAAQAIPTRRRLIRQLSQAEPAEVSRPGPRRDSGKQQRREIGQVNANAPVQSNTRNGTRQSTAATHVEIPAVPRVIHISA